ncbi:MAG: carbon storage regulator CsrA [Lachnospiraceae bacterium]|jgi:carbon storage regulator|nr:carbon storage regulator CsrA [Lachnospiraceae bacterium]SFT49116.1 carbon storage regulator, CsrA [Lachnospiraceae bacterium XBD2001]MBP5265393.1 carbon storage regulator CsrA [Lachnospiraceae bacterium]MBQ1608927.1 carbon storage regulator CsrA [Lachnospiraceae bacterium]MBQ1721154.1 carbon storage regulator CsrA [Lachnospiraceae bacterium]
MLALTRKKGESLMIDNNIEITILDIRGDQVKIGIAAPKEVPVYRKEVFLQIQQENTQVMNSAGLEDLKNLF